MEGDSMTEYHDPTEAPGSTEAPESTEAAASAESTDVIGAVDTAGTPEGVLPPPPPRAGQPEAVLPPPPPPRAGRPEAVLSSPPPRAGQPEAVLSSPPPRADQPEAVLPSLPPRAGQPEAALPSPPPRAGQPEAALPPVLARPWTPPAPAVPATPGEPGAPTNASGPSTPAENSGSTVPRAPAAAAPVAAKPATKRVSYRSTPRKAPPRVAAQEARDPAAPLAPAPVRPATLAIDVGGTGLKASVLDASGKLVADRVRVVTTYPCPPDGLVDKLAALVAPLPVFDRVSVGFPGVVRKGIVLTAPHFVTRSGPGSPVVAKLLAAWTGFDLAGALTNRLGRPVRVANDADLQGLDVVSGSGLEFVVTLGTGVGTALLLDGKLAPHLELAHHPFRKGEDYNDQLGEAALRSIGAKKWRKRVEEAFANFHTLVNYDRLYVGGGNARILDGHVGPSVTIVDNVAGILGGIKLWESPDHY